MCNTCLTQHLLGLIHYRSMQTMQVALHVFGAACQLDAYLMHICLVVIHVWYLVFCNLLIAMCVCG